MFKQTKYTYSPRGRLWVVYENEYTGSVCVGTPIMECRTKEKAREMVYKLNGWEKDGKVQN